MYTVFNVIYPAKDYLLKDSPPSLSFPHGQIFLLKWISPISIEMFYFSHFRGKKKKIKKNSLDPITDSSSYPFAALYSKIPKKFFSIHIVFHLFMNISIIYEYQLFDIHSS